MVLIYGLAGVLANIALVVNILLLVAVMALFGATLTLPGMAGILLTIGMAVDANDTVSYFKFYNTSNNKEKFLNDNNITSSFIPHLSSNWQFKTLINDAVINKKFASSGEPSLNLKANSSLLSLLIVCKNLTLKTIF